MVVTDKAGAVCVCADAPGRMAGVTEEFVGDDGKYVIRPLPDADGYICDGECEGCPVGPGMCSISNRKRKRHEHQDISDRP